MASITPSTTTILQALNGRSLEKWAKKVGWEALLNRAGTTFKKLPDKEKDGVTQAKALALMLKQPSMIKRPVLDVGGRLTVGFKPDIYAQAMSG